MNAFAVSLRSLVLTLKILSQNLMCFIHHEIGPNSQKLHLYTVYQSLLLLASRRLASCNYKFAKCRASNHYRCHDKTSIERRLMMVS